MKKKKLREDQYGEWLKGVSGKNSSRIGEGRDTKKMSKKKRKERLRRRFLLEQMGSWGCRKGKKKVYSRL